MSLRCSRHGQRYEPIADGVGGRVGEDDRGLGVREGVYHGGHGDMR